MAYSYQKIKAKEGVRLYLGVTYTQVNRANFLILSDAELHNVSVCLSLSSSISLSFRSGIHKTDVTSNATSVV